MPEEDIQCINMLSKYCSFFIKEFALLSIVLQKSVNFFILSPFTSRSVLKVFESGGADHLNSGICNLLAFK